MLLPLIPNLTADAAATPAPPAQGQSPSPCSIAQLPPDTMLAYFCPSGLESVRSQLCWAGRALLLILTCSSNMKAYKSTLEICLQNRIFFLLLHTLLKLHDVQFRKLITGGLLLHVQLWFHDKRIVHQTFVELLLQENVWSFHCVLQVINQVK